MAINLFSAVQIDWQPVLTSGWLIGLVVLAALSVFVALWRRAYGVLVRVVLYGGLALLLLQPALRKDERVALPDKVLIVVDDSASQKIAARDVTAGKALAHIQAALAEYGSEVEAVVLRVPQYSEARSGDATHIFSFLRERLPSLPLSQLAATILITDGQIHDAPEATRQLGALSRLGPLHVVLTGARDEYDRQVVVQSAPQYGLVDQQIEVSVKVEDKGRPSVAGTPVALDVWQDGKLVQTINAAGGALNRIALRLSHPGQNVFEFRTPVMADEMTGSNNIAPVIVNAVRDRLRVLLVSGAPHMGERAWRNLLKSDPGIDLIHFTILRPPSAIDATPTDELALIVFPVDELFNSRINDFDLIIFDKYQQFHLLPPQYFANMRSFIRNGGAFLLAMGSDRVEASIFQSPLADTLPVSLAGDQALSGSYRPTLTEQGRRHPVTADLADPDRWGKWLTQSPVTVQSGKTLLTGEGQMPLLVVDEVEKGRVAVITSDNLWMWSKDTQAGGPYNELLRNVAHWLMKEPELEEGYLKAELRGNKIVVAQRPRAGATPDVTITAPSGAQQTVALKTLREGWLEGELNADENGIYAIASESHKTFVVVGTAQSAEYADVITTPAPSQAAVTATRGGIIWYSEQPGLALRRVDRDARSLSGDNWLGLARSEAYSVKAVATRPLFDNTLFLLLAILLIVGVWVFESGMWRRRRSF